MDARKVGLGALLLATSGAILMASGAAGGRIALGLAGVGVVGLVANGMRDRTAGGRWSV